MSHSTSHTDSGFRGGLSEPFWIGSLRLPNRLVQAPMAGVSGRAFRLQARRHGAGLLFTEMVSSYGVSYRNPRTARMLELNAGEHPVAVQLFGNRPDIMAEAARSAAEAGADLIDINMGCPVRKVVKTGAGVALMRNEGLAAQMVTATAAAVQVPVTVKLRSGYASVTAPALAARLAAAGAAAVTIHPRTATQGWKGRADHSVTAMVVQEAGVPVIASGDIGGPGDAGRLLAKTGAAAVMVGRAALGNPWLFGDLLAGVEPFRRSLDEVLTELTAFHLDVAAEMGGQRAVRYLRKFYGWYLGPFRPSAELRAALYRSESFAEAVGLARAVL